MRIVNRVTFLSQPAGVLYSKVYNASSLHDSPEFCAADICIKGETIGNDFSYLDLLNTIDNQTSEPFYYLFQRMYNEEVATADVSTTEYFRDGLFETDKEVKFLIYSSADIEKLINVFSFARSIQINNGN